jgi:SAM-dependent methyltransferase
VIAEGNPDFYGDTVRRLLRDGTLATTMDILVVCGGETDRAVLADSGFRHVVISNLDPGPDPDAFAPFTWSHQDAERLGFPDGSFDFCVVHSGLHHCHAPHRALLEMYRVARKGLLLFEPYDNLLTRVGVRLNIGQEYEHASVFYNGCARGGVGNSAIPNHVYRWTEREIVKTVNCYAPYARHEVEFFHRTRVPWGQLRARRSRWLYRTVRLSQPALKLLERCFPRQGNNFAALVRKPELPRALHPWLRQEGGTIRLNERWLALRYSRSGHRAGRVGRVPATCAPRPPRCAPPPHHPGPSMERLPSVDQVKRRSKRARHRARSSSSLAGAGSRKLK